MITRTLGPASMILSLVVMVVVIMLSLEVRELKSERNNIKQFNKGDLIKTISIDEKGVHLVIFKKLSDDKYTHIYYTMTFKEADAFVKGLEQYKTNHP